MGAVHKAWAPSITGDGHYGLYVQVGPAEEVSQPKRHLSGQLVKSETALMAQGKIRSIEQIYLFSLPVKEYQIVEHFLGSSLKDEVMKIMPVQKQTRAGQRTRFKVS